ncbi:unnamed protein product [Blepharisma stoltei]|uniref:non-specific serine/threonine protein kinase n=1 Tax=Blepharisma stoltei TaxID=1481888 RepID=A0AAU9JER1_9CILI|nr:unnamed protein product [Blepharisma stoltei]
MQGLRIAQGDFVVEQNGKITDNYTLGSLLGRGDYSSVRLCTHKATGLKRAVKILPRSRMANEEISACLNEVSILRALDHPNIIRIYECYQGDKNYNLITELCTGGELYEKIISSSHFSEAVAAGYMIQLLSALAHCHERGVVHRQLRPEKLLLDTSDQDAFLKLVGFESARFLNHGDTLFEGVAKSYYIAPEVINRNYNEKSDLWSAGVILYILLTGSPPFRESSRGSETYEQKILKGEYTFPSPDWDSISAEAKDLITKLLTVEVDKRLSAREALEHPWFSNANREPINSEVARSIFSNLQSFRAERLLEKAAYTFIASQLSTKREKEEMIEVFKSLDSDNSGTLSRSELIEGYQRLFGDTTEDVEAEVDRIMQQVDTNQSGEIDYSEFIAATIQKSQLLSRERLEAAFKAFDLDGNGTISADELKTILGKNQDCNDSVWQSIISEVDQNGDGVIDFGEFTEMMLKHTN